MKVSDYWAFGAAAVIILVAGVSLHSSNSNRDETLTQLENPRRSEISCADEIKNLIGDLSKQLEVLQGKVESLEKAASNEAAFAQDLKTSLDFLPEQFKALHAKVDLLDGTVRTNATSAVASANGMLQVLDKIPKRLDGLQGRVDTLDGSVKAATSEASESAKEMRQQINSLPNQFKSLQGKMDILDRKVTVVASSADASLTNGDKAEIAKAGLAAQLAIVGACIQNIDACKGPNGYFPEDDFPVVTLLIQTATDAAGRAGALDNSLIGADGVAQLKNAVYELAVREDELGQSRALKTVEKIDALIKEIETAFANAANIPNEYQPAEECYYTRFIDYIQEKLNDICWLMPSLHDRNPSKYKEKDAQIKELQPKLRDLAARRVQRYQEHVIYWCRDTINLKIKKDMATSQINGTFSKVDSSLLHPEVARLYQEVLGKLLSQFNDDERLVFEVKIAQEKKWTLEDF